MPDNRKKRLSWMGMHYIFINYYLIVYKLSDGETRQVMQESEKSEILTAINRIEACGIGFVVADVAYARGIILHSDAAQSDVGEAEGLACCRIVVPGIDPYKRSHIQVEAVSSCLFFSHQ